MIKEYPEVKEALIQATKQKYGNLGKRKGEESDQILFSQHSVNWIKPQYPGAGNLI